MWKTFYNNYMIVTKSVTKVDPNPIKSIRVGLLGSKNLFGLFGLTRVTRVLNRVGYRVENV